ncbi:alpha/beta fold hydrolase [Frondihabitans australicus]|uniref:Pimeloyl-ACP methyl ester carboxylesterase n=1 Tax=Frondihabitans australicus TaxID=386892 RepID=A0A495IDA8_9MICO|nr:alpha/beta hydrolase [Frondihabitans australicus]RKR72986.1 pimeloyl-ACP methyl ester carboxylesterase [Frondihabitans australicus]
MRGTVQNGLDGTEIAYEVSGSGDPLILVHGSGLSKGTWRGLGYIRDLERDFTVIALDLRGHGRSGKPHAPEAYQPPLFIGDVLGVLDEVGATAAHYVGYSIGARIGLRIAAGIPSRLLTLTTIGGSFEAMTDRIATTFFPTWREALETGGMEEFIRRWGDHRGREIDPATALAFRQNDPVALEAYFEGIESAAPLGIDGAAAITVPTLLLAGTDDPDRYRQSQEAARRMARGSFFELIGQDHASSLLPVDDVTDLIRTFQESLVA